MEINAQDKRILDLKDAYCQLFENILQKILHDDNTLQKITDLLLEPTISFVNQEVAEIISRHNNNFCNTDASKELAEMISEHFHAIHKASQISDISSKDIDGAIKDFPDNLTKLSQIIDQSGADFNKTFDAISMVAPFFDYKGVESLLSTILNKMTTQSYTSTNPDYVLRGDEVLYRMVRVPYEDDNVDGKLTALEEKKLYEMIRTSHISDSAKHSFYVDYAHQINIGTSTSYDLAVSMHFGNHPLRDDKNGFDVLLEIRPSAGQKAIEFSHWVLPLERELVFTDIPNKNIYAMHIFKRNADGSRDCVQQLKNPGYLSRANDEASLLENCAKIEQLTRTNFTGRIDISYKDGTKINYVHDKFDYIHPNGEILSYYQINEENKIIKPETSLDNAILSPFKFDQFIINTSYAIAIQKSLQSDFQNALHDAMNNGYIAEFIYRHCTDSPKTSAEILDSKPFDISSEADSSLQRTTLSLCNWYTQYTFEQNVTVYNTEARMIVFAGSQQDDYNTLFHYFICKELGVATHIENIFDVIGSQYATKAFQINTFHERENTPTNKEILELMMVHAWLYTRSLSSDTDSGNVGSLEQLLENFQYSRDDGFDTSLDMKIQNNPDNYTLSWNMPETLAKYSQDDDIIKEYFANFAYKVADLPDSFILKSAVRSGLSLEVSAKASAALIARKGDMINKYLSTNNYDNHARNFIDEAVRNLNSNKEPIIDAYKEIIDVTSKIVSLNDADILTDNLANCLIESIHLSYLQEMANATMFE